MRKILEIIAGGIILAGSMMLGWSAYDTLSTRIEIEKEAKDRGISVYKLCKERGRSDVYEMLEIERGVKGIHYIWPQGIPIKVMHEEINNVGE